MRKRITLRGMWNVLKCSVTGFFDDKVTKLSGSLAYATVFSLGPFLIVIVSLFGYFFGKQAIEGQIVDQLSDFTGLQVAHQVQEIIRNATLSGKTTFALIVGLVTLFFGSTMVFAEIQDSINTIWGIKPKPKKGWLNFLKNRLLSFSLVVSMGFLLLVSLGISSVVDLMSNRLEARFPETTVLVFYFINFFINLLVITFLFAVIYKVLPDAKIKWRDIRAGSITTALLFMAGKFAIGIYIANSNINTTFGTAASIVILLVWVYFSSLILYFGAEFTKCWAIEFGRKIYPNDYAVSTKIIELQAEDESLEQTNKTEVVVENAKVAEENIKEMGEVEGDCEKEKS